MEYGITAQLGQVLEENVTGPCHHKGSWNVYTSKIYTHLFIYTVYNNNVSKSISHYNGYKCNNQTSGPNLEFQWNDVLNVESN